MNWYEIFSYVLNIGLLIWGVIQLITAKKEEQNTKSKIRNWHNQSEGIQNALLGIGQNSNNFSDKKDIASAVLAVAQSATALRQALEQERFFTDQEVKETIKKRQKDTEKLFKNLRKQNNIKSTNT